jgi:septum formation protein
MLNQQIDHHIVLASKSPRRHELLRGLGIAFEIRTRDTDESFADQLQNEEIALFLAEVKAKAMTDSMQDNELIITADTIVCLDEEVLNKPQSADEAHHMLRMLSGRMHRVYTGVCLMSYEKHQLFYDETRVYFRELSDEEIRYYVENYKPFDKAGSYGAQEWMGYVGVERIEGSYFNVMGLPVHKLYAELLRF